MIRGIHHIGMNCRDMDRMVRFYCEAFGFRPVAEEGFSWENAPAMDQIVDVEGTASRGILLKAGNCYLELFQYSAPAPERDGPLKPMIAVTRISASISPISRRTSPIWRNAV